MQCSENVLACVLGNATGGALHRKGLGFFSELGSLCRRSVPRIVRRTLIAKWCANGWHLECVAWE